MVMEPLERLAGDAPEHTHPSIPSFGSSRSIRFLWTHERSWGVFTAFPFGPPQGPAFPFCVRRRRLPRCLRTLLPCSLAPLLPCSLAPLRCVSTAGLLESRPLIEPPPETYDQVVSPLCVMHLPATAFPCRQNARMHSLRSLPAAPGGVKLFNSSAPDPPGPAQDPHQSGGGRRRGRRRRGRRRRAPPRAVRGTLRVQGNPLRLPDGETEAGTERAAFSPPAFALTAPPAFLGAERAELHSQAGPKG